MDKRILKLRQKIDNLDEEIIQLLKKRMEISKKVGKLKEELDIPVEDKNRENEIIDRLTQQAGKNLSEEQLIRIFNSIMKVQNDQKYPGTSRSILRNRKWGRGRFFRNFFNRFCIQYHAGVPLWRRLSWPR